MSTQSLNVMYASTPEVYVLPGRITNPGAAFVLTAGAAPKYNVSRTGAGVYVVTLLETPVVFLGADVALEGPLATVANGSLVTNGQWSYVYTPAAGSVKATVTFYTANATQNSTGPVAALTLADLAFSFRIFCADTNKVA